MATRFRIDPETCVSCEACVPECPLGAISGPPFSINPEICNACGACSPVCPTEAISEFEWTPPEPPGPAKSNGLSLSLGLKIQ
jgi:ferredoxin